MANDVWASECPEGTFPVSAINGALDKTDLRFFDENKL